MRGKRGAVCRHCKQEAYRINHGGLCRGLQEAWVILANIPQRLDRGKNGMGDRLLTIKQAAEFLGISKKTLYRYDEQGVLKPLRMPSGLRRYRKSDLESLLRTMETLGGLRYSRD